MLKKRLFYLVILLTVTCLYGSAQETKLTYGRFTAGYTHLRYDADFDIDLSVLDDVKIGIEATDKTHGASIEGVVGRVFNPNIAFFGEIGLNLTFVGSQKSEEIGGIRKGYKAISKLQVFAVGIPVNIGYKFRCSKKVTIDPYVGLDFKINAMMREKETFNNKYLQDHGHAKDEAKWTNLLSDCPGCGVGSEDLTWNKFQVGWHVGLGLNINKFYLGFSYGTDFSKVWSSDWGKLKSSTIKASIGFVI